MDRERIVSEMMQVETAERFLSEYRDRADAALRHLFAGRREFTSRLPLGASRHYAHLEEYTLRGGKRVRGALVLLGYEAAGGADGRASASALRASLSLELVHAGLLAHDDLMDRDELRRGGKALHVLAAEEAEQAGLSDVTHFGSSVAVLLAMTAQSMGYDALASAGFPSERSAAALRRLNEVVEGVVAGQLLDVCAAATGRSTREDIALIEQLKTGLYTTEGPLEIGALLAGAAPESEVYRSLLAYARPLGEAFQLIDDLLGTLGDAVETGKAAGDLREGKRTLLLEEAFARTSGSERALLESAIGRELDAETFDRVRQLIRGCGAEASVRERAAHLVQRADAALDSASIPVNSRQTLAALSKLVLFRRA